MTPTWHDDIKCATLARERWMDDTLRIHTRIRDPITTAKLKRHHIEAFISAAHGNGSYTWQLYRNGQPLGEPFVERLTGIARVHREHHLALERTVWAGSRP